MEVVMKKVYVAFDGKEFLDENECEQYETLEKKKAKGNSILHDIKDICVGINGKSCDDCPFFDGNESCIFMNNLFPCDWEL